MVCCTVLLLGRYIIEGEKDAISPKRRGTKVAPHYKLEVEGGKEEYLCLRLTDTPLENPFEDFEAVLVQRKMEADAFYDGLIRSTSDREEYRVCRQSYAGGCC